MDLNEFQIIRRNRGVRRACRNQGTPKIPLRKSSSETAGPIPFAEPEPLEHVGLLQNLAPNDRVVLFRHGRSRREVGSGKLKPGEPALLGEEPANEEHQYTDGDDGRPEEPWLNDRRL